MSLARMSISEAREASSDRLFQPLVAHAIATQVVQAFAFMHSCGIVHGDLHEGNILLHLPKSIDDYTPEQLYERYGEPELEEIKRLDGQPLDPWVPSRGVVLIWFGDASDVITLDASRIVMSDFSESFRPSLDEPRASHTPLTMRSPELFLDPVPRVSYKSEIWSLACAIFAIMGQQPLFGAWSPSMDRILEQHVDALGWLPEEWWARWMDRNQYFDDQLRKVHGEPRRLLECRVEDLIQQPRKEAEMAEMGWEEKKAFLELIRSMLAFEPEDRPQAQQVLESSWMQRRAVPAYESMNLQSGRTR